MMISIRPRVLLTGSTGMVGRNILEHSDIQQFDVLSPSRQECNLLDWDSVFRYITNSKPDFIIHAAGLVGGIQANIKEPVRFLLENLDMGRNVVWAARQAGVKKLLNLGSSCMYPRDATNPLKEEYVLKGQLEPTNEGYALAKIATYKLCEYISREDASYQYKTLIPCNLYGRWDKFDPHHSHLIPAIIHKIHEAKKSQSDSVEIWGDGQARREFLYAGDLADFILQSLQTFDILPSAINIGLGYDYTIKEYYQAVAKVIGYEGIFYHNMDKPVGMQQKLVDISQQARFGWISSTSLEDGIRKTYEYYLRHQL